MMKSLAVVIEEPERLALASLPLDDPKPQTSSSKAAGPASAPAPSGCSTAAGCRRFPAWAIRWCPATRRSARWSSAGPDSGIAVGATVFVPGAHCFGDVRGLHGGAGVASGRARRSRACRSAPRSASAACCWRWRPRRCTRLEVAGPEGGDLIVGHGVLGRLIARLAAARGAARRPSGKPTPPAPAARLATSDDARARRAPRLSRHHRRQRRRRKGSMR